MNMQQYTPRTNSYAFQLGVKEAAAGTAVDPRHIYIHPQDQVSYAAGVASVAPVAQPETEAAPVSEPVKIVKQQLKRTVDREYVRLTDGRTNAILAAAERYSKRIEAMMQLDPSGEMLWAA